MISLSLLIEKIRIVAAAEPYTVYRTDGMRSRCNYLPNGRNTCGCIIGEALLDAGVPKDKLDELDRAMLPGDDGPLWVATGWGDEGALRILQGLLTHEALTSAWVAFVQEMQDGNTPWAEAVRQADTQAVLNGWVMA
jgi:hypothetical protein